MNNKEIQKKDSNDQLSLIEKLQMIRNAKNRPALLLDVSGSMSGSKLDSLREILKSMNLLGIDIYLFNSVVIKTNQARLHLSASGGTDMTGAFNSCKQDGHNKAVLITDGIPDNAQSALSSSKDLQLEIIYVGPEPRPKFLDILANQSGGHSFSMDLGKDKKAIGNKIAGYLDAPSAGEKGPICL